ncbi:Lipoprotein-releasing system ATP-binding protein LolD [Symmachiella macrocystis]|uniref:Lipoprotein-releasing system ATP-binding protein LolD n=1 Tax=Symmachiella macrocystis TaxID=2527985 RepID=A0A5C6BAJ6_9PLAN|nr:ABC transporter ATP-binding protein [Symmachiella macrocystis]TWU09285.1 Lipoprotein-releasing system ATP-binding protein LolD [Symmachiella macrocystis]
MLRLEQVSKLYRKRQEEIAALQETDLEIPDGDYVAIIGPSGSGKTTLLSLLGGMLAPTTGKMWIDDESVYDLPIVDRARLRQKKIGFVFQTFNLVPYMTARENVQVPLFLAGTKPAAQQERATELLESVGLADRMDHKPCELSTGQQQRVALARTLANDPDLILADEPTGNLDPASRQMVLSYFEKFNQDGKTIVMVTHDIAAARTAQRLMQLSEGVLVEMPCKPVLKSA